VGGLAAGQGSRREDQHRAGHPRRHERGARRQLARRFWRPRKGARSCHARRTAGRRYRGVGPWLVLRRRSL